MRMNWRSVCAYAHSWEVDADDSPEGEQCADYEGEIVVSVVKLTVR